MSTNRKCLHQSAQMRMLIWIFAAPIWHKGLFHTLHIIYMHNLNILDTITPYHTCSEISASQFIPVDESKNTADVKP